MNAELESKLKSKNVTVIIDRSSSMSMKDGGAVTRWDSAKESVFGVCAEAEKFDEDGLDVYLFASENKRIPNVTAEQVYGIFDAPENSPNGTTALGEVLEVAFSNYFERKKTGDAKEGEIFLVITDGAPNDRKKVSRAIVEATKQVDHAEEIGLSFIQVGNDAGATSFLQWLDDDLVAKEGAKYDIVDTIKMADMANKPLKEVLINALID